MVEKRYEWADQEGVLPGVKAASMREVLEAEARRPLFGQSKELGKTIQDPIEDDEARANGAVMLAAPDLYEALSDLCAKTGSAFPVETSAGFAALRKARGEA